MIRQEGFPSPSKLMCEISQFHGLLVIAAVWEPGGEGRVTDLVIGVLALAAGLAVHALPGVGLDNWDHLLRQLQTRAGVGYTHTDTHTIGPHRRHYGKSQQITTSVTSNTLVQCEIVQVQSFLKNKNIYSGLTFYW